ncbi:MAG TPA: hypothetical protein VFB60_17930 [Ktedonobacteraceae bacterium]|nr:hypothetical protein [Ktedonobacteraceae bacterium]
MQDKTFIQAMEELQLRAVKEITDEALSCWTKIQQGETVNSTTAHIKNEYMKDAVTHLLFYILLQSLLFEAWQRQLIERTRYEELKHYIDTLTSIVKQQPLMVLPLAIE